MDLYNVSKLFKFHTIIYPCASPLTKKESLEPAKMVTLSI